MIFFYSMSWLKRQYRRLELKRRTQDFNPRLVKMLIKVCPFYE